MSVSKLYGMLQSGESETAAVRAVFFNDPAKKIRLVMYDPMNVGRSMPKIKRGLEALQKPDQHSVAMPLNWQPGKQVVVPPSRTVEDMEARKKSEYDMAGFRFAEISNFLPMSYARMGSVYTSTTEPVYHIAKRTPIRDSFTYVGKSESD